VQWFRSGLVFKAHRLLYHSTLGLRVIKKKKKEMWHATGVPRERRPRAFLITLISRPREHLNNSKREQSNNSKDRSKP